MSRKKRDDEHAETHVLDSAGNAPPAVDPEATAVLDESYLRGLDRGSTSKRPPQRRKR
jgi:hypothetical protein